MFFFERKLFFNIFCLRDREKNGDFSSLPLSKDFWRLLFIFIYHIYVFFFRNYDSLFLHPESRNLHSEWRFLHPNFVRSVSNLFLEMLSFFPVHFLHSEWRNLHSEWRFLHSNFFRCVMNIFLKFVFLFSSRAFSPFRMENSPSNFWTEISPCWMEFFSILTTGFISCMQNKENSILNSQISILLPVLNGEISILNGEISVLNGEISVLNGEISVLHSEWRNHRFEWIIFADMFNFQSFFFCGTLNGLHLLPKNETICIQNGDVPFLEGYLFILVFGLARGIRDLYHLFFKRMDTLHFYM